MSKKSKETLQVVIHSPEQVIWEGEAQSISSENSAGKFDVLPEHASFVTMLQGKPITVRDATGRESQFTYKRSVLAVRNGKVSIYADI